MRLKTQGGLSVCHTIYAPRHRMYLAIANERRRDYVIEAFKLREYKREMKLVPRHTPAALWDMTFDTYMQARQYISEWDKPNHKRSEKP